MYNSSNLLSKIKNNLALLAEDPNAFVRKVKSRLMKPKTGLIRIGTDVQFYIVNISRT